MHAFCLYSHQPLLSQLSLLPFIPHNKHSPSAALRCTLTIVSCTVYPCLPLHLITTVRYSYLNKLPLAFFITPQHSRFTSLHLPLLISILALCGDIHTNSGPPALSSFSFCIYNIPLFSLTIACLP